MAAKPYDIRQRLIAALRYIRERHTRGHVTVVVTVGPSSQGLPVSACLCRNTHRPGAVYVWLEASTGLGHMARSQYGARARGACAVQDEEVVHKHPLRRAMAKAERLEVVSGWLAGCRRCSAVCCWRCERGFPFLHCKLSLQAATC